MYSKAVKKISLLLIILIQIYLRQTQQSLQFNPYNYNYVAVPTTSTAPHIPINYINLYIHYYNVIFGSCCECVIYFGLFDKEHCSVVIPPPECITSKNLQLH